MRRLLPAIASITLASTPLAANTPAASLLAPSLPTAPLPAQDDAGTQVIERMPLDEAFAAIFENRTRSSGSLLGHFIASVNEELELRDVAVAIDYDPMLAMIELRGPRGDVERAKSALAAAMVPYRDRLLELDEKARSAAAEREAIARIELERRTVSIDWPGGALVDLVARVQAAVSANVILADPRVGELVIPPLSVRLVAPDVFFLSLEAIPLAGGHALEVAVISPDAKPAESGSPAAVETRPVIVVRSGRPGRDPNPTVQRIFDLGDFPDASDEQLRMLVEAIDFTMQANDSAEAVKVRFHEPSRILFVKGPLDAVELIAEIIEAKSMSGL